MTALIGGSILLIVASAAVLVFGWIGANENLIWGSIALEARHQRAQTSPAY